jgi:hypothetical protein
MKRALLGAFVAALVAVPGVALADEPHGHSAASSTAAAASMAPVTWGGSSTSIYDPSAAARDAPVVRARQMLSRARFLDDAAETAEKEATEIAARLPAMRVAAKAARDRVGRATPEEREVLGARAEDLETDVIVSDAEVTYKRRAAVDDRRGARDLRVLAVKLAREAPAEGEASLASSCDPPFRYTADGRKVYRLECLK